MPDELQPTPLLSIAPEAERCVTTAKNISNPKEQKIMKK
jgi:hypothetical protein